MLRYFVCAMLVALILSRSIVAEETPLAEEWKYSDAMRQVAHDFKGRPGVVLHVGDSITHANPYGQWARHGKGRSDDDLALLRWMHLDKNDDTDGWWLARTDLPEGRSYTAAGGLRMDQLLAGGRGKHPTLAKMLEQYQPQIVVLMLGTNDVSSSRKVEDFRRDAEQAVDAILASHAICILSTIPPHPGNTKLSGDYNVALREIATERKIPLIDYEREILTRRADDWNGTLMNKNDPHPSAGDETINAASEPTAENLRHSGYLLRGWLSVKKIGEVKRTVLDEK